MKHETISDVLSSASIEAQIKAIQERHSRKMRILGSMPGHLPVPTISNETDTSAWVSWSHGYVSLDGTETPGLPVLSSLEAAGYIPVPMTLVKWDNYRRSPEPFVLDDVPETKGRYKLTDSDRACPLWVRLSVHTGPSVESFYRAPDGLLLHILLNLPLPAYISARRIEERGSWHYERHSGKLGYPSSWKVLNDSNGAPCAEVSPHSFASIVTEQSIDGAIYFRPFGSQSDFPLSPAQMLTILMESK